MHGQEAVRKALVIVNNVVLVVFIPEKLPGPEPEGVGLGKSHGGDADPFQQIDGIGQFFQRGGPEKVFRVVEVKAGEPRDPDVRVEKRIRGAGDHVDVMAQVLKGPAQILQVNALSAAVGITSVT